MYRLGLIDIWSGVSTLGDVTGSASGVFYGMITLRVGTGSFSCGGSVVDGGIALGGMFILKTDTICFNASVFLPIFVSGVFWVGPRKA